MHRRIFLMHAIAGGAACLSTGCGMLLHPERINQPHSRDIDWKIVALDGLGLAFFFVPGVIAFAVDFYTGAIYLPPEYAIGHRGTAAPGPALAGGTGAAWVDVAPRQPTSVAAHSPVASGASSAIAVQEGAAGLHKIALASGQIDQPTVERCLAHHTGQRVQLDAPGTRVSPMHGLADFATHRQQHGADPSFGMSVERFFRRLGIG